MTDDTPSSPVTDAARETALRLIAERGPLPDHLIRKIATILRQAQNR